ncbi:MAG TPA: OsmC family protein [bacterium]|jgi:uncharacterized OsmC-like protein/TusA-related sulfurtransferase
MLEQPPQITEDIPASAVCDGGNLDCGSGLLLVIRKAMDAVQPGGVLEIRSTETSVCEDLPAWCRMTRNPFLGWRKTEASNKFFVRRGDDAASEEKTEQAARDFAWQTRVRWSGGPTTKVYARNHAWEAGQPASFDVQDAAPSAVEYLLGAVGSCLTMGFQIHASRRGIVVEQIEMVLSGKIDNIFVFLGTETEGHSGFKEIHGTVYVQADAEENVLQEIWRHTVEVSPVLNSIGRGAAMDISMRVV